MNQPPVLQAALVDPSEGNLVLGAEGIEVTLSLAGSQDPENAPGALTIDWDDDSSPETLLFATNAAIPSTLQHRYHIAGEYAIQLSLWDRATPPLSAQGLVQLTIAPTPNDAPVLCFNSAPVASEGGFTLARLEPLTLSFLCSTDGDSDLTATGTLDIDFGNGDIRTGIPLLEATGLVTQYPSLGIYPIEVTLHDGEGQSARLELVARVENRPPQLELLLDPEIVSGVVHVAEDERITLSWWDSSDSDSNLYNGGTVAVDWGEGEPEEVPFSELVLWHTYALAGSYEGLVTLRDADGGLAVQIFYVTVAVNEPPLFCITTLPALIDGTVTIPEGDTVRFDVSCSSDPDGDLDRQVSEGGGLMSIDWGDGTTGLSSQPFTLFKIASHSYNFPATYVAEYTIRDEHGAPATGTVTVVVEPE